MKKQPYLLAAVVFMMVAAPETRGRELDHVSEEHYSAQS